MFWHNAITGSPHGATVDQRFRQPLPLLLANGLPNHMIQSWELHVPLYHYQTFSHLLGRT